MWATLVPVLIGGLLTLAGGFIGPLFLQRQKDHVEERKRRADKFEELVAAVYEFDHWIENCKQRGMFGAKDIPAVVSPFAKVQSISSVYFPRFDDAIKELDIATSKYRIWMTAAGMKRLTGKMSEINEGFNDAYMPYVEKREGLLIALKKFAGEEFQ
jgi:hypothetical protein